MADPPAQTLPRHEHRLLAPMLVLLHVVIWWDFGGGVSRSLMLAHFGLFLLWQPLLGHEKRLDWRGIATCALIALLFVGALGWLLLGFWLLLLIGLVAGRVTVAARQRYAYLVGLSFLVLEFLIGWVPRVFALTSPTGEFMDIFRYGLLVPPAVLFFVPAPGVEPGARSVDFLYGLAASMLTLIVGLGSLTVTLAIGADYPVALIQSVMGVALFLLAIAWLWAPMAGFSGLGQLWERYVQNAGSPFELWLDDLQRNARTTDSPERFLDGALARLARLPWVAGIDWKNARREGRIGEITPHVFRSRSGDLVIAVHGYRRMGTTLMLHARLLVQLVGHFYRAKQSEQEMTRQAHVRAIYETGARVTHDIKNLLQSLRALASAVEASGRRDPEAAGVLVRRQLPHVVQRLQLALDKLQAPVAGPPTEACASAWWRALTERNVDQGIAFSAHLEADPPVPAELFDSVAENLIENARAKRRREPGIAIRVSLHADAGGARLTVEDDGAPVSGAVRERLFRAAVDSEDGLGIGLYQAARFAAEHGYELVLRDDGDAVRFELAPATGVDADAPAAQARSL